MADFKKQIKKGILELGILKLLNEQDQYGYSIIQEINKRSDNSLELKDGTLYPILYRLEDNLLIESYWSNIDDSRTKPRKYYKITNQGKETLDSMFKDYELISNGINKVLYYKSGGK